MPELPLDLPQTSKRGTRLSPDWTPSPDLVEWCRSQLGMNVSQIASETEKFVDYWIAQPGQRGVKLDWPATWRNWCRKNYERQGFTSREMAANNAALRDIASVVRKPWCQPGRYSAHLLEQCVEAGLLTKDEMEAAL